jgi:hypothetical protein
MANTIEFHNGTDEQVKVCVYKTSNVLDVVPCEGGVVFLEPYKSAPWHPASGEHSTEFDVRFFHPALFDKLLARSADVSFNKRVTITKNGSYYESKVESV